MSDFYIEISKKTAMAVLEKYDHTKKLQYYIDLYQTRRDRAYKMHECKLKKWKLSSFIEVENISFYGRYSRPLYDMQNFLEKYKNFREKMNIYILYSDKELIPITSEWEYYMLFATDIELIGKISHANTKWYINDYIYKIL